MRDSGNLLLPCLRATMGDWVYYVASMTFSQIVRRIHVGKEIYGTRELRDMLQRALSARADDIADYLVREQQRFFNAIVAAIYEGEPEWYPVELKGNLNVPTNRLPEAVRESIGVLSLTGNEKIFALDGQHRLKGMEEALKQKPGLESEELTVIFVGHKESQAGKERTRRLFSTLNRYAKPVTLGEIIILDEDDMMAIVTRWLVEQHPLLSKKKAIYIGKTKAIPSGNKDCLTSIQTVYEVLSILFFSLDKKGKQQLKDFKRKRPSKPKLDAYYGQAEKFWDTLARHIEPLRKMIKLENIDGFAVDHRSRNGGNLIFRPVGMLAVARAIRRAIDARLSTTTKMIQLISRMPLEISKPPWAGLLWNTQTNLMLTAKKNQEIASLLLVHMARLDLKKFGSSREELLKAYAAELNKEPSEVKLPFPVKKLVTSK